MYSTCLHCNKDLGINESIEAFPIGRRIAFDESKGRLWAVCTRCERWNLSPIEERWEAIEACEKAFRETRVRVSTDNIGLAKLREGTELVRVGAPMRPEFAAWRYGDQFGRRMRKNIVMAAGGVAGAGLAIAGVASLGISIAALAPAIHVVNLVTLARNVRVHSGTRLPLPDGHWFTPVGMPRLVARDDVPEGWGLAYSYSAQFDSMQKQSFWQSLRHSTAQKNTALGELRIRGNDAVPVMRWVMPRVNRTGASRRIVSEGVGLIEAAGAPEQFGTWAASQLRRWSAQQTMGDSGDLQYIPAPARLAFEMAMHEDSERRALEGELSALEAAWRDADEIAKIADGLLVGPAVEERLIAMRERHPRTNTPVNEP